MSLRRQSDRGSGDGRSRLRRSRQADRLSERDERIAKERNREDTKVRFTGRVLPPCLDCGDIRRETRVFFLKPRAWAPFCTSCWIARGKPTMEEVLALAAKDAEDRAAAAEAERKRRVESGEAPW